MGKTNDVHVMRLDKMNQPISKKDVFGRKEAWIAFCGCIISIFNIALTGCACGYHDGISLPAGLLAFGTCWYVFFFGKSKQVAVRITAVITCIIVTVLLAKIIADILYFGHDPLFKY